MANSPSYDSTLAVNRPGRSGATHFDGDDATWAIAATDPCHAHRRPAAVAPLAETAPPPDFHPQVPTSLDEAGLRPSHVEALILKFLLNAGQASGREIAGQVALPFTMIHRLLCELKESQLLALKSEAPLGDYQYELTEFGGDRARRHVQQCTYFGAAPVSLEDYAASVAAQSVQRQRLTPADVQVAFQDLVLSPPLIAALGEALNLGRGLFLHGAAGNGKSTIAEHLSRAFSRTIWIPRAISAGGEIVRLFDSIHHLPAADDGVTSEPYDRRWVCIQRPTIAVGGELDLAGFDVTTNPLTGISEAPLQLKSNCGTLVIDDFGRNRFRPEELLNRLVVPLERCSDSLQLKSGRTFRVPFDCMIVFSSNLAPAALVDEAFSRRIPYKIDIPDPTPEQFVELARLEARQLKISTNEETVRQLIAEHFTAVQRPLRFCHPRDLMQIVANACDFNGVPRVANRETLAAAVRRYFG